MGSLGALNRVRRNHALEHAAISVITERHPNVFLRGRSNRKGFYVFGEVGTEELRSAIDEALRRLAGGESELAIHPRCGTNLAVAGVLSGLAAAAAANVKPRQNRFAYAVLASIGALMVSPGIGMSAQRHLTTLAEVSSLRVLKVQRKRFPFLRDPVHWVQTESN
jgi:Domain of unknown function (DUF6391)